MSKSRERQRHNRRIKNSLIENTNGSKINDPTPFVAVNKDLYGQFQKPRNKS